VACCRTRRQTGRFREDLERLPHAAALPEPRAARRSKPEIAMPMEKDE